MLAAEKEVIRRGCMVSTLDAFSFQVLNFYQKLGCTIFGTLSGYSGDHERHYLQKKLAYTFNNVI